jgi:hypothetical protein
MLEPAPARARRQEDGMFGVGGLSGGSKGGPHYECEVNEDSINMKHFSKVSNERWANGYRMAHVFTQDRNTVVVWERID